MLQVAWHRVILVHALVLLVAVLLMNTDLLPVWYIALVGIRVRIQSNTSSRLALSTQSLPYLEFRVDCISMGVSSIVTAVVSSTEA